MAKHCAVCGKKLGLLEGRIGIADGMVCASCWAGAGQDMSAKSILNATNKTSNQLRDLIEIEALKREAQKAGLKEEIAVTKAENASEKSGRPLEEKRHNPERKADTTEGEELPEFSAIDIVIAVTEDNGVAFLCEGRPLINFDDLINGREMVIGDGFVQNESEQSLPEVRIACEFDPPIIDPGIIYYEADTFEAKENVRFEIDDPPVNLEEYAKIKRARTGKVKFTLFLAEQEMDSVECDMRIKPGPAKEMEKLMRAALYEEEKNASGPVNVFLYARENGTFEIDLMRNPELLYSMYSNGREQLIGDVYVVNETNKNLKNLKFEADFTSDILSPVKVLLGNTPPSDNMVFEVDDPAIDVSKLEMLTEIENCIATYSLSVDGKTVAEATGKITICPYNQWNAALILLPAYMTPNHPNVINVLQNASKWMLVNGMNPSLEGYQSDAERVEEMVSAVFNSVKEANIIYSNPPASFFGPQRIRLCETVLNQGFATCMDMTILFASCLESFGLHPVLITAPGHIFAGVWLNSRSRLKEPVLSDAKLIQKYIEDGQLVAVECTAMNMGKDMTYEDAKEIAVNTIKTMAENNIPQHECIDVQIARAMGVRPLPMRVNKSAGTAEVQIDTTHTEREPVDEVRPSASKTAVEKQMNPEPTEGKEKCYCMEEYKSYEDDLSFISIDNFYDKKSKRLIKDAIADIVTVEGPISQPALIKKLISQTSLGRTSKQIAEHLDKLVATADVKITRQSGTRFLWISGTDPNEYLAYRQREQRNPEDICKYELKNAVCYLIQENGPMTKDEIAKAMVQMLGYNRSSKKIEDGAAAAIKAARELKEIEQDDKKRFCLI